MSKQQITFTVREVAVSEPCGRAYEVVRNDGFVKRVMRFYEDAVAAAAALNKAVQEAA